MGKISMGALSARLAQWWRQKSPPARLYTIGGLVFGAGLIILLFAPKSMIANWALSIAMFCTGLGLIREFYTWAMKTKDYPLAKLALALMTIVSAALATGAGGIVLWSATNQDPSYFRTSIALMSPFAFVPVMAIVVFLVSLFGFPFVLLLGAAKRGPVDPHRLMARCLGLLALLVASGYVAKTDSGFSALLRDMAAYSAYQLDMHPDSACSIVEGDRITRISDELVIIGRITDAGPRFVRQPCVLGPEAITLAPPRKAAKSGLEMAAQTGGAGKQ